MGKKKKKEEYSMGGTIAGGAQILGGIGLMATGAGAAAGIPLLASGVGSIAHAQSQPDEQIQQPQMLMPSPEQQFAQYQQNQMRMALGGAIPQQPGMMRPEEPLTDQVTGYEGGDGTEDSIKLGDVAYVDDGEVRVGDYIFSNKLKEEKKTYADHAKDVLKELGWDEKKEKFMRPYDEATRNTLKSRLDALRGRQEEKRARHTPQGQTAPERTVSPPQMALGGQVPSAPGFVMPTFNQEGMASVFGSPPLAPLGAQQMSPMGGVPQEIQGDQRRGRPLSSYFGPNIVDPQRRGGPLTSYLGGDQPVLRDGQEVEQGGGLPQSDVPWWIHAAQAAGPMHSLVRGMSPAEEERYERVSLNPEEISLAAQRRGLQRQGTSAQRGLARNVGRMSGSAGQALSTLASGTAGIAGQMGAPMADSAMREQVHNVQARNQAAQQQAMQNAQIQRAEVIANAANRARRRDMLQAGISGLGSVVAQRGIDQQASQAENIRNQMLQSLWEGQYFQGQYDPKTGFKTSFKEEEGS